MSMSDPLADMLTRLRNAVMVKFDSVEMPLSTVKVDIAKVLKDEGFIRDYQVKVWFRGLWIRSQIWPE